MAQSVLLRIFFFTLFGSIFTSVLAVRFLLTRLQKKKIGQAILEIGPNWHKKKEGTPTMGGIAFLFTTAILILFYLLFLKNHALLKNDLKFFFTLAFLFLNGGIGLLDDLCKQKNHQNQGLRAMTKFALQSIVAILYLFAFNQLSLCNTFLAIPFTKIYFDLGLLFYPFAFLFLVGICNSVNLTDGIDGLASSVTMTLCGFLCVVCIRFMQGNGLFLSTLCCGICVGFLFFNAHPARIFMGDTGSLFLGGAVAGLAIYLDMILFVCICGIFFIWEAISVLLQVGYFKLTHKRLFKMAPFHHHLEQCGYSEEKIVWIAVGSTLFFAILLLFFSGWIL